MNIIKMKVLAIDPGFERIGIALIEKETGKKEKLVHSECFQTTSNTPFPERLKKIGLKIENIIKKYKPNILAIEKLYFTTNQKTAMGVSEARGLIIYIASKNNLSIHEYTPPQIKIAVTGYGRADKKMVMSIVPKLIEVKMEIKYDDEIDAIAIGLTCLASEKFNLSTTHKVLQRK